MRIMPNHCATMLICVDKVADGNLAGKCVSLYLPEPLPFSDPLNFVSRMDEFFDSIDFPQAYLSPRRFSAQPKAARRPVEKAQRRQDEALFEASRGGIATFAVQVLHRQNSSWQGRMVWREQALSCRFRSTLEMIRLMLSASLGTRDEAWENNA